MWHADPVTTWNKERLFFAHVDSDKRRIMFSSCDPATGKLYPITISTEKSTYVDSHDHPAICVLPDESMLLASALLTAAHRYVFSRFVERFPRTNGFIANAFLK